MIEILYSIAGSIAVVAGTTQVRQLVKVGRSEEFSLATWTLWFTTQVISLSYALTLGAALLILFNVLWMLLYGAIVTLIVYYRRYPRQRPVVVPVEVTDTPESVVT